MKRRQIIRSKLAHDEIHFGNWNRFIFEKYKNDTRRNRTFDRRVPWPLMAKYIAQSEIGIDESIKQEHHVRTVFFHCEPCSLGYDVITQLEKAQNETQFIAKQLNIQNATHFGRSYSKARKRTKPWTQLTKDIIKELIYNYCFRL